LHVSDVVPEAFMNVVSISTPQFAKSLDAGEETALASLI